MTMIRFIFALSRHEFRKLYLDNKLGVAWLLINPALQLIIFTFVLHHIGRFHLPYYPLYLIAGMVTWRLLFINSFQHISRRLLNQSDILRTTPLAPVYHVLAPVTCKVWAYLFGLCTMFVCLLPFGVPIHLSLLWLPIALLPAICVTYCLSIFIAFSVPRVRDIEQVVRNFFQLTYWVSPIVYPASVMPAKYQWLLFINPFYLVIRPIQDVMYFGNGLNSNMLIAIIVASVFMLLTHFFLQSRVSREIIYYI